MPILCVDIGGTSTKAGLVQTNGNLAGVQSIPTRGPDATAFVRYLCALVDRVRQTASLASDDCPEIIGLGVAVAGFLNADRTTMVYNSNLPWLENYPLRDYLAEHLHLPVELEVDSNAACMAEYCFGSGRGSRRFLCLTAGTGLAVGMAIDGVPLRFAYECLGDPGHIILQRDGPLCTCGGRGCAEILVSAPALAQRYREETRAASDISLRDVIDRAKQDDHTAIMILRDAGAWLGIAAASLANIFFPDRIAIAGGLSAAGELLLDAAEEAFRSSASAFAQSRAHLCLAELGSMATLVGAAWPFLNRTDALP